MIAFDSNVNGSFDIYVVASGGGTPLRLTTNASTEAVPTWSRDSGWVYFTSWRTGREEVWKVRSTGAAETQVTRDSGALATESAEGKYLYFVRGADLFRMQADGSHATKVAANVAGRFLSVFPKGIYFASGAPKAELRYLEFKSGAERVVAPLPGMPDVDVSSDEHWILYPQPTLSDTNLMVVEMQVYDGRKLSGC
jgi:Tol biopolymer transport system component